MKKLERTGWKPVLFLVSMACFFAVAIGFAKATPAEGLHKLKLQAVVKQLNEEGGKKVAEEPDLVQIRGDVLSVAVISHGGEGVGESFLKVRNKAEIGDDYIVCFMHDNVSEVFSLGFSKGLPIRAWGIKFSEMDEYENLPVSGYLVVAARVVHEDVPPYLANIGIPYDLGKELKKVKIK